MKKYFLLIFILLISIATSKNTQGQVIGFITFKAVKLNNILKINFTVNPAAEFRKYNIELSSDAKNWVSFNTFKDNGSRSYSTFINLSSTLGLMVLGFIPLIGFKKKKLNLIISLCYIILLFSCKKEKVNIPINKTEYKFVKIEAIDVVDNVISTNIIRFNK